MMKWILIFHLLSPPVVMPEPYDTKESCVAAGEATSRSCRTTEWGMCHGPTYLCVPQPKKD
jgi:hypothetical protein